MQDKIAAATALKESKGLNSRVGTNIQSRTPQGVLGTIGKAATIIGIPALGSDAADKMSGAGQDFSAGVHKLVSGLTLDALIEAKARGATFGSLTEGELGILANSASQLNDWEIKDKNGKGTGVWNIDERSFKKEIDNIQNLTQRAIVQAGQSLFDNDEESVLDQTFNSKNQPIDPSNYFQ